MESQVKDTVYTHDELKTISETETGLVELQNILGDRGVSYHHANKEDALIGKILQSNPEADPNDGGGIVPEVGRQMDASVVPVIKSVSAIDQTVKADSGIVKLELINSKKTGSLRVRDYTYNGDKKLLRKRDGSEWIFMITKNVTFDLSIEDDRMLYNHLKTHPYVLGGGGLVPSVKLSNLGQDSLEQVNKEELAMDAKNIIKGLGEEDLRSFARIIGVVAAHKVTPLVVKGRCYDVCNSDPKFVLQMWNDPRKDLRALVFGGMDKGFITKDKNVFKYDNMTIGTTEDEVTLWFEKNADFLPGLRNKIQ